MKFNNHEIFIPGTKFMARKFNNILFPAWDWATKRFDL